MNRALGAESAEMRREGLRDSSGEDRVSRTCLFAERGDLGFLKWNEIEDKCEEDELNAIVDVVVFIFFSLSL